jgi:hypothetical protein
VTFWWTPGISTGLHANMSLLCQRKSTSSLYYLGSRLALIYMIFAGSLIQMCMTLASSSVLKMLDVEGMAVLRGALGTQRLGSLRSAVATATAASSMLTCSQSNAHCVLASTVQDDVVVAHVSDDDRQIDPPDGNRLFARDHSVERVWAALELVTGKPYQLKGVLRYMRFRPLLPSMRALLSRVIQTRGLTLRGNLPGFGMLLGWSVQSKLIKDSDQ